MRALTFVVVLAVPMGALAQLDATAEFNAGRQAYDQKRYPDAIRHLTPLLYPAILLSAEEQIVDTHKMLAVSHFMSKDREAATREVVSLLGYRRDYILDPVAEPPTAVAFFEEVKQELEARARAARQSRAREEERRRLEALLRKQRLVYMDRTKVVERVVHRRTRVPLYLPFGFGQFHNGERGKGWLFLAGEAALLGTAIATWGVYEAGQGEWRRSDDDLILTLKVTNIVAGVGFLGVATWGIIDALLHAKPRETVTTREEVPSSRPARTSLFISPGGIGLSATF